MDKYCCFILYENFEFSEELKHNLYNAIERLIKEKQVNRFVFYFYNKCTLECLNIICELKCKYSGLISVKAVIEPTKNTNRRVYCNFDECSYFNLKNEFAIEELLTNIIDSSEYSVFYYDRKNKVQTSGYTNFKMNRSLYYYALENNKMVYNLCTNKLESFNLFTT